MYHIQKLNGLNSLVLSSNNIYDIDFLKGLDRLNNLNLSSNQIKDISSLAKLDRLNHLDLSYNQITDISILQNLKRLKILVLYKNQLTDMSPLSSLKGLTELNLGSNRITDISPLSSLKGLTKLKLDWNALTNLKALEGLIGLTYLYLQSNQITDVSVLEGLTSLTDIYLDNNQLTDINALEGLTNLRWLILRGNQLTDISPLSSLTGLEVLDLAHNQITNISFLEGLTGLEVLDLTNNQITNISFLEGLTGLKALDLGLNKIESIPEFIFRFENAEEIIMNNFNLNSNPLINPPIEIIEQGVDAVLRWFGAEENGEEKNNRPISLFKQSRNDICWWLNLANTSFRGELNDEELDVRLKLHFESDGLDINQLLIVLGLDENFFGIYQISERSYSADFKNNKSPNSLFIKKLHVFDNPVSLSELRGSEYLLQEKEISRISSDFFNEIIDLSVKGTSTVHVQNIAKKTKIDNDGAMAPKDFLGFDKDIRAFSITLAQKRLVPPVAVALFGNWGMGKSFFMHHLEKNIDHLSRSQSFSNAVHEKELTSKPFCEGVVQIKFNAWSYLDTNLWAGLIANIFEKLDEYVSGDNVLKKEKDKAQKIIADQLDIVAHERENLKVEIESLKNEQDQLERDLKIIKDSKDAMHDSVIKKSIDDLKLDARKSLTDLEETVKDQLDQYGISKQRIHELSPSVLLDEISSWVTFAKNLGRFNSWQILLVIFIIVALVFLGVDPGNCLTNFKDCINTSLVYFLSISGPVFMKVYQSFKKFNNLLKPVTEYKNKFNEAFETLKLDYDKSLITLNKNLDTSNAEIFDKQGKLYEVEKKIEKYNYALEHSVSKRAFFDFIKRKANEESYESHLGLISIIRRDFEKLSALFEEVNIPDNLPPDERQKLVMRQKDNNNFRELFSKPLDRIILYVDDLDRCDDDKVLEVLEAVHLLMAFPLFVVVVGVDKRCVGNALRYRNILKYTSMNNVTPQKLKDDYGIQVIEPEEYLEKIFQIPFRLKAAKPDAIKGLIENLLKHEIGAKEGLVLQNIEDPLPKYVSSLQGIDTEPSTGAKGIADQNTLTYTESTEPEDLLFTDTELTYLQEISVLVGDSPRTIKRFINIYRIIRAHEQLNYRNKERELDFLIVMFILGLVIGRYRNVYTLIFEKRIDNESKNLEEVLKSNNDLTGVLSAINESETLKLLLPVPIEELDNYIDFVSRFSFN